MNKMNSKRSLLAKDQSGFTLIEVLIASMLTAVIATFIFNLYINQHKVVTIQEQITDMQQNGRASIDELAKQIRMAGYGLPLGLQGIVSSNTNPDTITISYNASNCAASVRQAMPEKSAELKLDYGADLSCFSDGMWAYIFDPAAGVGEPFQITHVQDSPAHLQHRSTRFSQSYGVGSIIITLDQVKFYIDESDALHPTLMVQIGGNPAEIYAENIEDLQFVYTLTNGSEVDMPTSSRDIRLVQVEVQARTDRPDPDFPDDPYRERIYNSAVSPRNIDG